MFLNIDLKNKDAVAAKDCEGCVITYGGLCTEIDDLKEKVTDRTVVFCLCKNTVGALVGYLSFVEQGAVPLMLGNTIDHGLLENLLNIYTPAYIWLPVERASDFSFESVDERFGYCLLKTGNEVYPLNAKLQLLMTTSGSTGSPKLVRYKKGNLEANAKNVAKAFGWTEAERPICDLAMQYTMGLNIINTHLYVGATLLLVTHNLMSSDYWDFIKEEKATNFTGVPFSYDIMARLHFQRIDLPYLTTLAEGGGKLTDKRFTEMAEYAANSGKRFIATFGTTETSARLSLLPAELALEKTGSIGRAIPEGELFLIDKDGNVLTEVEAEGEMCYRGPNVTMGYAVCRDDLQKDDEWQGEYHTGDLARRDADGCYYITGRMSRFLKLLSYRVSLDQCEQLIHEEFRIDCACTGTDQRMDIYITDDSKIKDIQSFICEKTGLFKNLFKIFVVDEIPRGDSGKIRYTELQELHK